MDNGIHNMVAFPEATTVALISTEALLKLTERTKPTQQIKPYYIFKNL